LARQGHLSDALVSCESVIELSGEAGDQRLGQIALLTKAELLQQIGNNAASMETLDSVVPTLAQQPPDLHAHYERILACALAAAGGSGGFTPARGVLAKASAARRPPRAHPPLGGNDERQRR
jgi:hypothetical protein